MYTKWLLKNSPFSITFDAVPATNKQEARQFVCNSWLSLVQSWVHPKHSASAHQFSPPQDPLSQICQRTAFLFTALYLSSYPSWCMTQVRSNAAPEYQFPSVALTVKARTLETRIGHMIWGWKLIFGTPDWSPASYIPQDAVTFPRFSTFTCFTAMLFLLITEADLSHNAGYCWFNIILHNILC